MVNANNTNEAGITYGIPDSKGVYMAIAAFTAVAWYNVAELNIQVFLTFKRHRGLYFWSLIISSYGCVLHALGFLLKFFLVPDSSPSAPNGKTLASSIALTPLFVTIITIGWYAMVTGQSIVLYSRLHLVVRERKILRGILIMIIVDAICFHIPTTVLTYGSNKTPNGGPFVTAFNIMEKLQMTAFCIQEFIISGVYVWSTISLLRPVYHGRTRKVMTQLVWINLIIIGMDVCLLALEYSNIYYIEATMKAMVYSIKLKLEFAVLNQLMTLANSSVNNHQNLRIDDGNEKAAKEPPGRSRSTEYISNKYKKPVKPARSRSAKPGNSILQKARSTSRIARGHQNTIANPNQHQNQFLCVPALDRHATPSFIDVKHIENAEAQQLNIYTNPAACYKPGKTPMGYLPHDGLGGIPDSPTLSPTDRGPTPPPHEPSPRRGRSRRAAPPPSINLDKERAIMPSGVLRSTRPSVSDWAHGPESEPSPGSDEVRLDPYDQYAAEASSPVHAQNRSDPNERMTAMDFMTSALQDGDYRPDHKF